MGYVLIEGIKKRHLIRWRLERETGFEPTATRLKVGYSTTELHARVCLTLPIIVHLPLQCKRV